MRAYRRAVFSIADHRVYGAGCTIVTIGSAHARRITGLARFYHPVSTGSGAIVVVGGIAAGWTAPIISLTFGDGLMTTGDVTILGAAGYGVDGAGRAIVTALGTGVAGIASLIRFDDSVVTCRGTVVVFVRVTTSRTTTVVVYTSSDRLGVAGHVAVFDAASLGVDGTRRAIITGGWTERYRIAGLAWLYNSVTASLGAVFVIVRVAAGWATLVIQSTPRDRLIATRHIAVGRAA